MQNWQQRVMDEKTVLDDNLSRLIPFIGSETFNGLPEDEQKRLRRQEMLMELYSEVLAERITNFA